MKSDSKAKYVVASIDEKYFLAEKQNKSWLNPKVSEMIFSFLFCKLSHLQVALSVLKYKIDFFCFLFYKSLGAILVICVLWVLIRPLKSRRGIPCFQLISCTNKFSHVTSPIFFLMFSLESGGRREKYASIWILGMYFLQPLWRFSLSGTEFIYRKVKLVRICIY